MAATLDFTSFFTMAFMGAAPFFTAWLFLIRLQGSLYKFAENQSADTCKLTNVAQTYHGATKVQSQNPDGITTTRGSREGWGRIDPQSPSPFHPK